VKLENYHCHLQRIPSTQEDICVLDVQGSNDYKSCVKHVKVLAHFASQMDVPKFLLDCRHSPYEGSVTSQYLIAYKDLERVGYHRHWKTALLISPEDDSHNFLELVATNAGYTLKVFRNINKAFAWLES